jgi:hypothetical protein
MKKFMTKKQYESAIKRSVSRAVSSAYTAGNRAITSQYRIKMGDVRSLSEKQPQKGLIRYGGGTKGRMLTTTHFGVTPGGFESQAGIAVRRRKKYHLTVKKGQKKVTRFFMLPGKPAGMLWQRTGRGPKAVRPVKAVSIAQMANKKVQQTVQKTMQTEYDKRFRHEVEQIIKRAGGKPK